METARAFQDRGIGGLCEYLSRYCDVHINGSSSPSPIYVKPFHEFLPKLLEIIFGTPDSRGWMQTEITASQSSVIVNFLSISGSFFSALMKLSEDPECSYDLITSKLPEDIRQLLSTESIHLLPPVYRERSYKISPVDSNVDVKKSATFRSMLVSPLTGGDRRIKLTPLDFYLYYFANVPTWKPLQPPIKYSINPFNRIPGFSSQQQTTPQKNIPNSINPLTSFGTTSTSTSSSSSTSSSTNPNAQYQANGNLIPTIKGCYTTVLDDYLEKLIPITSHAFPAATQSFFFDVLLELWIRTPYISPNSTLNEDYMSTISKFVSYIARHDLRPAVEKSGLMLSKIYRSLKDELFMLISRLAINWAKNDSYKSVIELWSIWAAPWRFGAMPRSSDREMYTPISDGWSRFILQNLPCYFFITEIFFQRIADFQYKEGVGANILQSTQTNYTPPPADGTIGSQLRTLYRLLNVYKANGLVDFLACAERGLEKAKTNTTALMNVAFTIDSDPFKKLSLICYRSDAQDQMVHDELKTVKMYLIQLENDWKPKGFFSNHIQPRPMPLLQALSAIHNAALVRSGSALLSVSDASAKAKIHNQITQLKATYGLICDIFQITGDSHLNMSTTTDTSTPTVQSKPKDTHAEWVKPAYAGLKEGGQLTEEELMAVRAGKMVCAQGHAPVIGIRDITYVRSYENPILVRWSVLVDSKLNDAYLCWVPIFIRKIEKMPKRITVRPLAAPVNLFYCIIFSSIVLCIIKKIVFK